MSPAPQRPASAVPTQGPTAYTNWFLRIREDLRAHRAARVQAGAWPHSKWEPLPQPVWLAREAHSITQDKIWEVFRAIGEGAHNRTKHGQQSAIIGKKIGESEWQVIVSVHALAGLLQMPPTTVERNLAGLEAKHSIGRMQVRTRGERVGNREPTGYHIRTWGEVLRKRREDPKILTTHGEADPEKSLQWHNGRANSKRLLRPDEGDKWDLSSMPPKPATKKEPGRAEVHAQPVDADKQLAAAAPKAVQPISVPSEVPPDQQRKLDAICSYVSGARFEIDHQTNTIKLMDPPIVCDLAPKILAAAQRVAIEHGKVFPPQLIGTLCQYLFERRSKLQEVMVWSEGRKNYERMQIRLWTPDVEMPSPYLLRCCGNSEQAEQLLKVIDNEEFRSREELRVKSEITAAVKRIREHPDNRSFSAQAYDLASAHPKLFEAAFEADVERLGPMPDPAFRHPPTPAAISEAIARRTGRPCELAASIYRAAIDQGKQVGVEISAAMVVHFIGEIEKSRRPGKTTAQDILTAMPETAMAWARSRAP